jgi:hypothetical protein
VFELVVTSRCNVLQVRQVKELFDVGFVEDVAVT